MSGDLLLLETGLTGVWAVVILVFALYQLGLVVYRAFYHPLAAVPGPFLAKCSPLWQLYHAFRGDECSAIRRLHEKHGSVVRVAPNEVDLSDGAAIAEIYSAKGGFTKAQRYRNFNVDGHPTIFSAIYPAERLNRAKAVSSMFSAASLRESRDVIEACADRFVSRLVQEVEAGGQVDILNLARAYACDVTTLCLFQDDYGALGETGTSASVNGFMASFVDVGKFFYLPPWLAGVMTWLATTLFQEKSVRTSIKVVESYLAGIIGSKFKTGSFSDRLLRVGVSDSEAMAQSKDLLFAGTHLPGVTIAMLCWFLARNPDKYAALRKELLASHRSGDTGSAQYPPYLQAAVKEAMRLTLASPVSLPRVVPASGMNFRGYHFPGGTNVGLGAFQLHLNPQVFPNPEEFIPERWEHATPEMVRDLVPFGMGTRACIARNLATAFISEAVKRVVEADVLAGAGIVQDKIVLKEWFNSKVMGDRISLVWPDREKSVC